jgi:hypothetical protein
VRRPDLLPAPPAYFVERLRALEQRLRDAIFAGRDHMAGGTHDAEYDVVRQAGGTHGAESDVVRQAGGVADYTGDTIYRIDERGETALLDFCAGWARSFGRPFVLVAEGLRGDGRLIFPQEADPADAAFECIVDPIDGTRGLMYGKRSAWALAAVAPAAAALGRPATLADVAVAVQTELPTERARLADTLWAIAGQGAAGITLDLATGAERPLRLAPSRAPDLSHGFATIAKFFPGTKERAAWLEERLFAAVAGDHAGGAPLVFDDEYISSGGQLYELMVGHDRFTADLRPVLMDARGIPGGSTVGAGTHAGPWGGADAPVRPCNQPPVRRLCARPYDLCTALIAEEAGVHVADAWGRPLDAPLDTSSDVSWAGYANARIRALVEPVLHSLLRELGAPPPPHR